MHSSNAKMADTAFNHLIQLVMETALNIRRSFVIGIANNGGVYQRPIDEEREYRSTAAAILLGQFPTLVQTGLLIAALVVFGGTMTNPRRGRGSVQGHRGTSGSGLKYQFLAGGRVMDNTYN